MGHLIPAGTGLNRFQKLRVAKKMSPDSGEETVAVEEKVIPDLAEELSALISPPVINNAIDDSGDDDLTPPELDEPEKGSDSDEL